MCTCTTNLKFSASAPTSANDGIIIIMNNVRPSLVTVLVYRNRNDWLAWPGQSDFRVLSRVSSFPRSQFGIIRLANFHEFLLWCSVGVFFFFWGSPSRDRRRLTGQSLRPWPEKGGVGRFAALGVGTSSRMLPDRTGQDSEGACLFVHVQ